MNCDMLPPYKRGTDQALCTYIRKIWETKCKQTVDQIPGSERG